MTLQGDDVTGSIFQAVYAVDPADMVIDLQVGKNDRTRRGCDL